MKKGRRQGPVHKKLMKAKEAKTPVEDGGLLRRQDSWACPAGCDSE